MKTKLFVIALSLAGASSFLYAQSVTHSWHVIDHGGGISTSNGVTLQSSIGQPAIQASNSGGIKLEEGYIPGIRELPGTITTVDFITEDMWNLVSVPLIVGDYRKTSLYPTGISQAFSYTGSYQVRDTLKNGIGYWIRFPAQKTVEFAGTSISKETLDVNNAWNMIGCLSYPVLVSDITPIPPTTILSNYFGYSSGPGYYMEDTLKPGRGYWVKVNTAGKIVMTSGSTFISPSVSSSIIMKPHNGGPKYPDALQNFSTLTIRDAKNQERTLYFSTTVVDLDLSKYELPPAPPSFDARYATNRMLEIAEQGKVKEIAIQITSAEYPLTISWNTKDDAFLLLDRKEISLKGPGTTQISNPESPIKLKLSPANGVALPKKFALHQNYPNPFNPSTVIRYDLPAQSHVTLKVYNVLGQEVATLADDIQEAGYKSIAWNASTFPSGMYFYRINVTSIDSRITSFTQTGKMILVK